MVRTTATLWTSLLLLLVGVNLNHDAAFSEALPTAHDLLHADPKASRSEGELVDDGSKQMEDVWREVSGVPEESNSSEGPQGIKMIMVNGRVHWPWDVELFYEEFDMQERPDSDFDTAQFDAAVVEGTHTSGQVVEADISAPGQFDLDAILADMQKKACQEYAQLKKKLPLEKAKKTQAKKDYKGCKKKIKSQAKKYKKFAKQKAKECKKNKGKQGTCQGNRDIRKRKRLIKRKGKGAIKQWWKDAKKTYKKFSKKVKSAKFKCQWNPKIVNLFKPQIQKALADMNMNDDGSGSQSADAASKVDPSTATNKPTLKTLVKTKIFNLVDPKLENLFAKIMDKLWKLLGKVKDTLKSTLVAAVGSIPFVGGMLAAVIGSVIDMLYEMMQKGINAAIKQIRLAIEHGIINGICDAVFGPGDGPDTSPIGGNPPGITHSTETSEGSTTIGSTPPHSPHPKQPNPNAPYGYGCVGLGCMEAPVDPTIELQTAMDMHDSTLERDTTGVWDKAVVRGCGVKMDLIGAKAKMAAAATGAASQTTGSAQAAYKAQAAKSKEVADAAARQISIDAASEGDKTAANRAADENVELEDEDEDDEDEEEDEIEEEKELIDEVKHRAEVADIGYTDEDSDAAADDDEDTDAGDTEQGLGESENDVLRSHFARFDKGVAANGVAGTLAHGVGPRKASGNGDVAYTQWLQNARSDPVLTEQTKKGVEQTKKGAEPAPSAGGQTTPKKEDSFWPDLQITPYCCSGEGGPLGPLSRCRKEHKGKTTSSQQPKTS